MMGKSSEHVYIKSSSLNGKVICQSFDTVEDAEDYIVRRMNLLLKGSTKTVSEFSLVVGGEAIVSGYY